jgi:LPXTG-motif cell wall-anchored protein
MRYIFSLIIIGFLLGPVFSQSDDETGQSEIQLRTYIEEESIPLNREVIFHIELNWPGDLSRYKISEIVEPTVTNLATRGSGSSNKVRTDGDGKLKSIKEITFYFRPLEMGMAYIDGVIINYQDTATQKDESLISSRIGVKIIEPLPESSQNNTFTTLLGTAFFLLMIGLAIYFYLRYRKKQREAREKALSEVKETVEEKYLRLLKETVHFNTDNIKDSLGDLAHLLSGYISERFNIPASSMSDESLFQALAERELSEESLSRIKDFYAKASLVKFAGESVNESGFHRLYDTIELVLENQKSINTEEDK